MSEKEARRVYVMEKVLEGQLTVKEGARLLNLSERQVKRLKKGMKEKGVLALAQQRMGQTINLRAVKTRACSCCDA